LSRFLQFSIPHNIVVFIYVPQLLVIFAKLRKATIRFVMSSYLRLSARNNSAPTERFFMKFDI